MSGSDTAGKSFQVHGPFAGPQHIYPTEKRANTAARKLDAHLPKPGTSEHEFHVKMYGPAAHTVKPATASKGLKSFRLVSLDDYYDEVTKADPAAPPAPPGPPAKTPRRLQRPSVTPTTRMKPISDEEAMTRLRGGNRETFGHRENSQKALATGYSKVSGGGALRAPNRGDLDLNLSVEDLNRAVPRSRAARPTTSSSKSPRAVDSGGAAELSLSLDVGDAFTKGNTVAKTDFNDLFKSELGIPADEVLCACPHCEAPITKSDLEKGHKGKGATTHQSGPKHGKSSAHVRDHNPEGGTMRGGDGRGVHTPSRGVPGAKKTDEVHVQTTGRHKGKLHGVSKAVPPAVDDESSDDASSDHGSDEAVSKAEPKRMVTIRGTEFVRYIDDGSDAALAKAISEGTLGGTPPTQPLDLNNDMTRLLV